MHEGTARWYTKGCVTKVGRGWPPEPATRNSALRVGREGGKKSDKTMERNLNYAPRKMAIACKAMLIRRRRKTGGRRFRRRRQTRRRRFFLIAGTYFFPFFFLPSVASGSSWIFPVVAPLFAHLVRRHLHLSFHFRGIRSLFLSIYLRIVLLHVPRVWSPQFRMINCATRGVISQMTRYGG